MTLEIYENHCPLPQLWLEYSYGQYFLCPNFHSLKLIQRTKLKSQENDHIRAKYFFLFYLHLELQRNRGLMNEKIDLYNVDSLVFVMALLILYRPDMQQLSIWCSVSKVFKAQLFVSLFRSNLNLGKGTFWKKYFLILPQLIQWIPINSQLAH